MPRIRMVVAGRLPAIFDYIELSYNRERIHQTNEFVSPVMREASVVL